MNVVYLSKLKITLFYMVFSSPVRKYRKSYCSHPGIGVCVHVAQMLKFLV